MSLGSIILWAGLIRPGGISYKTCLVSFLVFFGIFFPKNLVLRFYFVSSASKAFSTAFGGDVFSSSGLRFFDPKRHVVFDSFNKKKNFFFFLVWGGGWIPKTFLGRMKDMKKTLVWMVLGATAIAVSGFVVF